MPRNLLAVVAVLGLATYCVSFGPVINDSGATGWYVRFAALAALCATFSVLPRQKSLAVVTAVLAAMGFLDGLSSIVGASETGWAMTAIVVLNALQTVAAVAAVLLGSKDVPDTSGAGYEAYVDYYNQAVRTYYAQQGQPPAAQQAQQGYGQAHGQTQAAAGAQRAARSSQYADYSEFDYGRSRGGAGQDHDTAGTASARQGLPSYGQAPSYADRHDRGADGSTTARGEP